ncbi:Uncharacterised protein [Mycobacteroides abscessus]|uniref:Uncharacterized protein n=2 Tax=Mycolicibacterium TaxID=1866885 RepID=A0A0D1JML4_9MYCO|nr:MULTISPECIES: hypothetical protein [Mycobacteriaceae]MEE3066867.1 hypothetical protein [Actinomycetota bacterium]KIU13804.1 hypothetical protein TL10_27885 [Mycolicibacterium llatzerense]MCQ4360219.1 hypothetical protein [Mycobacterium gordonae]MCT7373257.1 hypothetical protein [Mycolicibacterium llatzerense]WGI35859.1 hypothetical protein QDT91_27590 [Mycolicibacterium aubagnense]
MLDFTVALTLRARRDRDEEPGVAVTIGRRRIELRRHHSGDGPLWNRLERGGLYRRSLLPIGPIAIVYYRRSLTYGEAVGAPPRFTDAVFDWVIDEFDDSFNDLAIASLRYHQDWAITFCDGERRARYQDLIDRLSEPSPDFTDEERAVFAASGDRLVRVDGSRSMLRPPTDRERAVYAAQRERTAEWEQRMVETRRDFVGVMRELWS